MLFVSIFLGAILPSCRRKCKFFLKTESPRRHLPSSWRWIFAYLLLTKIAKREKDKIFFDSGKWKRQLHQGKILKNPKFPLAFVSDGKSKIFLSVDLLVFLYLWPMVMLGISQHLCIFSRLPCQFMTAEWRQELFWQRKNTVVSGAWIMVYYDFQMQGC